jgi:hypothetical protein
MCRLALYSPVLMIVLFLVLSCLFTMAIMTEIIVIIMPEHKTRLIQSTISLMPAEIITMLVVSNKLTIVSFPT